jgi:TonB family protein
VIVPPALAVIALLATASAADDAPVLPTSEMTLPIAKHRVDPVYPNALRLSEVEGFVVLQAEIRRDGTVGKLEVLKATHGAFAEAAVESVRQWLYEPARLHGEPVAVLFTVRVGFALSDRPGSSRRPVIVDASPPPYPKSLEGTGRDGVVRLRARLASDGRVLETAVLESPDPAFSAESERAVRGWRITASGGGDAKRQFEITIGITFTHDEPLAKAVIEEWRDAP